MHRHAFVRCAEYHPLISSLRTARSLPPQTVCFLLFFVTRPAPFVPSFRHPLVSSLPTAVLFYVLTRPPPFCSRPRARFGCACDGHDDQKPNPAELAKHNGRPRDISRGWLHFPSPKAVMLPPVLTTRLRQLLPSMSWAEP